MRGPGPQVVAPPRHERQNYKHGARSVSAQGDAAGSPVSVISSARSVRRRGGSCPFPRCADDPVSIRRATASSSAAAADARWEGEADIARSTASRHRRGVVRRLFFALAAAPHLGGLAALLLQSAPCLLNRTASSIPPADARGAVRD